MKEELKNYLLEVAKAGYANSEAENTWTKNPDRSTTITHENNPWSMHDNFFGGEPYAGREVIFHNGKPYWIMVYYGEVDHGVSDIKGVYSFLQKALSNPDPKMPLRGPREFTEGNRTYMTSWEGDIENFSGIEWILDGDEEIYSAKFMGGLVDQRDE